MVRKCSVCQRTSFSQENVSFHRFPANPATRKIWLSLVGINDLLPKSAMICSEHFEPAHIFESQDGKKHIKPDCLPKLVGSPFDSSSHSSSPSSLNFFFDETSTNSANEPVPSDNSPSLSQELSSIAGPSGTRMIQRSSSSMTVTASEAEMEASISVPAEVPAHVSNLESKAMTGMPQDVNKKKRKRYIGDMSSSDFSTPDKRRKNIQKIKQRDAKLRREKHNLQKTVRRLRLRITNLTSLLKYLKEKALISEKNSESAIRASVSGPAADIFERMLKGPTTQQYNESLRSFAITLAFYSARAYNFVRDTFNKSIPHINVISRWYKSIDGKPGFTEEALTAIRLRAFDSSKPILCNLVMDEMSIRRQVEWTGQKFTGYVDIGANVDGDTLPEAKKALVFMVVAVNDSWKVPVGYFLLNGLESSAKAELVKNCIKFLHEANVTITSLTFDGAPVNISMAEKLGCDFHNTSNLKTNFNHPITEEPIFVFLDACHMLKLIRNCFASIKENEVGLTNANGQKIDWHFIRNLDTKQKGEGLHLATKIQKRHLEWYKEKMKVRLAAQTLSRSVSVAIDYLREDLKDPLFLNSEATSEFILLCNNIFDIFNSQNNLAKYYFKKPISQRTCEEFFNYMINFKDYILGLKLNNVSVLNSRRKTGFLGILIDIESIRKMYLYYVEQKKIIEIYSYIQVVPRSS